MTNEQAVRWLNGLKANETLSATKEALDIAIKALETGEVCMSGEDYNLYLEGYKDAKKELERSQDKWTPISERLPEEKWFNPSGSDFGFDFEEVLCTTIWGNVRAYKFGKPQGHDKPHFWLGGRIMDEYVIAWQYKPEPYKESGEE